MKEIWKDIKDYEMLYQVSNFGRIKSLTRTCKGKRNYVLNEKILKPIKNKSGYYQVILYKNRKRKSFYIHKLVCETFINNNNNFNEVNHINGNKSDNRIDNLEWCNHSQNAKHAFVTGLNKGRNRKVFQFDINGNFVKKWNSILDVEKHLKIFSTNISKCCRNKVKTAGGYLWKYE